MRISTTERNKAEDGFRLTPYLLSVAAALVFLLVWKIAAVAVSQEIIIPQPETTFRELALLAAGADFRSALLFTVIRGIAGFTLSLAAGLVIGSLAGIFPLFKRFFSPFLTVTRSTPVMSVILLALIWFRSDTVPVFVAFLTAFPIITANVIEGLENVDKDLVDMGRSYRVGWLKTFARILFPSMYPYLLAGCSAALGLSWKVVVAAEVLSQPLHALGSGLAEAKSQLDTAEVFAWTIAAIVLSAVSEWIFFSVSRRMQRRRGWR